MMPKHAIALAQAIAGHCDGVIDVQSAPGESSRFRIHFPSHTAM